MMDAPNEGGVMTAKFPPAIRRNWGYWDGVSARARNRLPEWNKAAAYRCRHPFDRPYGEGFWIGWYGEEPPKCAVKTKRTETMKSVSLSLALSTSWAPLSSVNRATRGA